jgi:hypothetical protein
MRLYAGPARHFVSDSARNQMANELRDAYFAYIRYNPSPGEAASNRP